MDIEPDFSDSAKPRSDGEKDFAELSSTINLHAASSATISDSLDIDDVVENCRLIAKLGHGCSGRVFLAEQPALANRPIVLKLTPGTHDEHLNLARLQHTHIMPLYWASYDACARIHVLAMPFLGRTTLARLLDRLDDVALADRNGERGYLELRRDQDELPIRNPVQGYSAQAAQALKRSSWVEFIVQMGQQLAEALAFAHERGLLHLDIKPSNILITAEGQPILLDLDVARKPVAAGTKMVPWFGGTPAYMSPEQRQAMEALSTGKPTPVSVDERSDIYSLGKVLHVALAGSYSDDEPMDLRRGAKKTPDSDFRELAPIIARCTAKDPADRYPSCSALAVDLERQLNHQPLIGVREPWSTRWRKWRRRRPLALPVLVLIACLCAAMCLVGANLHQRNNERLQQAETALLEGQELHRLGQHDAAARRFGSGKDIAARTFGAEALHEKLGRWLKTTERLQFADELTQTLRRMRYCALEEQTPRRTQFVLEAAGRKIWARRAFLTDDSVATLDMVREQRIRQELQELVVLWTELQMRVAPMNHKAAVRAEVDRILDEAQEMFASSFAVNLARKQHGMKEIVVIDPQKSWEHCAQGRIALRSGDLALARTHLQKALELDPLNPVCSMHVGVLAMHEKQFPDAVQAFSCCLGADPSSECFTLRGEAYAALGRKDRALADFGEAIARNPIFARPYQVRSEVYQALGRIDEARADRFRSEQLGQ